MKRENELYIKDILDAINSIHAFIGKMTFDEFMADDKTISAVIRKLEIIGEAAKNIPETIRLEFPNIQWNSWCVQDRQKLELN